MVKLFYILSVCLLAVAQTAYAQVSHGGKPLPWEVQPGMRSASVNRELFVEMPTFDVQAELRMDSLNERDLKSGYRFAYKFMTNYDRENSGIRFTLPDGTKVWRLGIRSAGALTLNVLFTQFELPEGSQLFLYNSNRSQVLGAFNHLNNSDLGLLPVAPVAGEELIVEYQEPAHAPFRGKLTIGEVNHGYRALRGNEPRPDLSFLECMPALACFADEEEGYARLGRSVVLLMIDGYIACSGVMMNNTAGDGKPYLLTASHCLNLNFSDENPDYQQVAGRIVSFFNYDSPFCRPIIRGTEEQTVASARSVAVNEQTDLALLELLAPPPVWYRPYYAGWNVSSSHRPPYAGIHHPNGSLKRIGFAPDPVERVTFNTGETHFNDDSHWHVRNWSVGGTSGGSSGSPLFDAQGAVVGALSGGSSSCLNPRDDYYYALDRSWVVSQEPNRQLKHWLNPSPKEQVVCPGLDPYSLSQAYRLSNVVLSGGKERVETALVPGKTNEPLFGNNSLGVVEYAEAYQASRPAKLYGVFLVAPAVTGNYSALEVDITVYDGAGKPQTLLHKEAFHPTYLNLKTHEDEFQETIKPLNRAQESYVHFSTPVTVEGSFYIGYKIKAPQGVTFSVYNLPKGISTRNTTWVHASQGWIEAAAYAPDPFSTSLFLDPVLQYETHVGVESVEKEESPIHIYIGADRNSLHVVLPQGEGGAQLSLLSVDGRKILSERILGGASSLSLPTSLQGVYVVNVDFKGRSYRRKVMF